MWKNSFFGKCSGSIYSRVINYWTCNNYKVKIILNLRNVQTFHFSKLNIVWIWINIFTCYCRKIYSVFQCYPTDFLQKYISSCSICRIIWNSDFWFWKIFYIISRFIMGTKQTCWNCRYRSDWHKFSIITFIVIICISSVLFYIKIHIATVNSIISQSKFRIIKTF